MGHIMGVSDTIGFWPGDVTKRSWHTFLSEPAFGFTLYSGGSSRKLLATEHTDMSHEDSFHLCFECHQCLVWLMPFVKGLILVTSSALGLIQGALNAGGPVLLASLLCCVCSHFFDFSPGRLLNFPKESQIQQCEVAFRVVFGGPYQCNQSTCT